MKAPGKIQLTVWIFGLAGAALFTILIIRQGIVPVRTALATAGWGITAVVAYHFLVPLLLDSVSWWALFPKANRPRLRSVFRMRWVGESVSNLLPSAQIGGDIVRARLAAIHGAPAPIAAGTVLVDITLSIFMQVVFTLLGLALLVSANGHNHFVRPVLIGSLIGVLGITGFYFVQRRGMFRFIGALVSRIAKSPDWHSLVRNGGILDVTVQEIYSRRRAVIVNCTCTLLSFVLESGECWIALHLLSVPATVTKALILVSAQFAIRSAMFPIPGGLGVQEGGYLLVGNLLGIPGETAFALSLIERACELAVGIPGLVIWQVIEGRRLLRVRAGTAG